MPLRVLRFKSRIKKFDDAWSAAEFCADKLKMPWPKMEPMIMKEALPATKYSEYVLKKRWPEAECYIIQDAFCAYYYSTHVMKHRWIEAEDAIKKDKNVWKCYSELWNIK